MRRFLRAILPHLVLVLALMFLVLLVPHEYNPYMNFIGSSQSRVFLLAFCLLALILSVSVIARDRRG